MGQIEDLLRETRSTLKDEWADSTFRTFGGLIEDLELFAKTHGYQTASQELYDAWLESCERSKSARERQITILKDLDARAGTRAFRPNGKLYNALPFPDGDALLEMARTPLSPKGPYLLMTLIARAYRCLVAFGESLSTLGQYLNIFREIREFFVLRHEESRFDSGHLAEYMEECTGRLLSGELAQWKWKIRRRAAAALEAVAERGSFSWEDLRLKGGGALTLLSCFEPLREEWRQLGVARNLRPATIELRDYIFRIFIALSGCISIEELKNMTRSETGLLLEALKKHFAPSSLSTVLPMVRQLLSFVHEHLRTDQCLAGMVMTPATHKQYDNSHLSAQQENKALAELSGLPCRDQAIILLALTTGLRQSDICGLRLDALDWRKKQILIRQEKTNEVLCLPLLPSVADPLARYILDERPQTQGSPFVFLRNQPPYQHLTDAYLIISRFLQAISCAPVDGDKRGLHMLRHTLAHRMLESRVPLSVITDTLGHASKESTKAYVSADEHMLRECALGFGDLPRKTWKEESHG